MRLFSTLCFLASILAGLGGLLFLSQATMGVGIIGFALLLGVFARLLQAQANHNDLRQLILAQRTTPHPVLVQNPVQPVPLSPSPHVPTQI